MSRMKTIFKTVPLQILLVMACLLSFNNDAQAAACGSLFPNGCENGFSCVSSVKKVQWAKGDYTEQTIYNCVPTDKANSKNIVQGGTNTYGTGLKESSDYTPSSEKYDLCSNSCAPSCYYEEMEECWLCPLFKTAFNESSTVAALSIKTFSGPMTQLVIIAFGLWIAMKVLAFVSSPETRDFKDLGQSLIQQGFFVALVVILLQTGGMSFFNLALNPVFQTGMTIAEKTLSPEEVASAKSIGEKQKNLDTSEIAISCGESGILTQEAGGALPEKMGESIICTMTLLQNRASKIKALGSSAICYSWKKKVFIIPHLGFLLTGIGLWVGAMVLIIAMPFLMLDSVIQITVAAALLPMAIAAYAFKITRSYVKPVWDTFLNAMFVFMFVSLIVLMLTTAFEIILIDTTQGSLDEMIAAGNDAVLETILKDLSWTSVDFLKVCFVLILTWTVMGEAKGFAGNFSGSISSTGFGSQIGGMGASFVKSATKKTLGRTAEAIADESVEGVKFAGRAGFHYFNRARMNVKANKIRNDSGSKVTVNNDGSQTYTDKKGNKATFYSDGTKSVSTVKNKTRRDLFGRKKGTTQKVKQQNEYFRITQTFRKDKNGKIEARNEKIRLNSTAAHDLIDKKGRINTELYNTLLNSGQGEMGDMVKVAVAKRLISERMPNLNFDINNHEYVKQNLTYDDKGNFTGYTETHADGSMSSVQLTMGENGRLMTSFTLIDAGGSGYTLSGDGLLNRKQTFRTQDGTVNGEIDSDSVRNYYDMDEHFSKYDRNHLRKVKFEDSLFDDDELEEAMKSLSSRRTDNQHRMFEFRKN